MTKQISLTQGKFALVDDEDYDELMKYKWCFSSGYAIRRMPRPFSKTIRMHRIIMKAQKNQEIDHINMDKLDNRRKNLRLCTHPQNHQNILKHKDNKTGFKGVTFYKNRNKFGARIKYNGIEIHLGLFVDSMDAARAYNEKALELFGEFANLNKLD